MTTKTSFADPNVEQTFTAFPQDARRGLLSIRELIFDVAARTDGVGELQETLKWGQPAYLTPQTKSGSTIRLGIPKQGGFAIYTHCQTTIISEFQDIFPDEFSYEGNRAIHFQSGADLSLDRLQLLIKRALTYHLS
jgi:hypothetical protein